MHLIIENTFFWQNKRDFFSCINFINFDKIFLVSYQKIKPMTSCSFRRYLSPTLFFAVFYISSTSAKTVVIGNGTGYISKISMGGLVAGDVLAITPGSYSGAEFSNLHNVSIINNGALVVFKGTVSLSALKNVVISGTGAKKNFYGIQFNSFNKNAFETSGNLYGLRIYNCEFIHVDGNILDVSDNTAVYNGDTSGIKLYKTTLANLRLSCSGVLLQGYYGTHEKLTDVIDSIAIYNIKIDSTLTSGQEIAAGGIYRMDIHDWKVIGYTIDKSLLGDVGMIQTAGYGQVYNIYRHGGRGYIWRQWNTGLDLVGESYIYNVIDLATNAFGFIDTRVDSTFFKGGAKPPFTTGGNMHIVNNTIGNKTDENYVTPVVILGSQCGYKTEVRNNLAFNIKGFMINNNSGAHYDRSDSSTNLIFKGSQILDVLSDTILCLIKNKKSPVVDRGTFIPFLKTDIGGVPRPHGDAFDIGARECL